MIARRGPALLLAPRRAVRLAWIALAVALAAAPARADDPAPEGVHARARELFRKGFALLQAGDCERALDFFLRSREAEASGPNTRDAAHCLDRLGRYDEALQLYEELLLSFPEDLDEQDRAIIGPAMAALRKKVGGIDVRANVRGTVVVDGRARGELPLSGPVRVLGGKHTVRILNDGYAPFEASVTVAVGATEVVDARLVRLSGVGLLRVEDVASEGADVLVDGALVGTSPWEGTLKAGPHLVWTRRGERGSAPGSVVVLEGQTALVRPASGPLGPELSITAEPVTADIALDGVVVGKHRWAGRVPVGDHRITIEEEGYRTKAVSVHVPSPRSFPVQLGLRLDVDPQHPRWVAPPAGKPFLSVFGGLLSGTTLRGDAESGGPSPGPSGCTGRVQSHEPVGGYLAGLRGGYAFRRGAAVEITGGAMSFARGLLREERCSYRIRTTGQVFPVRYDIRDDLRVRGGFAALGASHRAALAGRVGVETRLTAGVLFASTSDALSATASTDGAAVAASVSGRSEVVSSPLFFVMPEVGLSVRWDELDVTLSLAAAFFPASGGAFEHAQLGVQSRADCDPSNPGHVACSPNSGALAGERSTGPFVLASPQIGLRYQF